MIAGTLGVTVAKLHGCFIVTDTVSYTDVVLVAVLTLILKV